MFSGIRVLLDAKNAIQKLLGAFLTILAYGLEFASTKGRIVWEIWIIEILRNILKKVVDILVLCVILVYRRQSINTI